jgi:HD-GYP domain-containing protein (c-di-GMP phosphodiesterase class II)
MSDRGPAMRVDIGLTQVLESGVHGLARDVVRGLNVALRTARIHDLKNDSVLQAIDALASTMYDLHRVGGGFTIKALGSYLFWNDTRLKSDAGSQPVFDSVCRELQARGIGSVTVNHPVDRDAVSHLVLVLNTSPMPEAAAPPDTNRSRGPEAEAERARAARAADEACRFLNERLRERTPAFEFGPWRPADIEDFQREQIDNKERAKKTFFRAVAVTRAVMTSNKLTGQLDVRKAKRVVQSMVDLIMEEEFSLLGMTTLKSHDDYTFFHSVNVCVLSIAIGKRLGLDRKRLSELGVSALLHDIGKTEIPLSVIRKPGKFDREEWDLMRKHPALGVRVLVRLKGFSDLAMKSIVVAFEHHMGMNLQGYPPMRRPRPLHLFSRIVTVADCFDAMTTQRVYSDAAKPRDKALSYMLSQSGKLFDPILLKMFVNLMGVYPIGTLVRLTTGQLAVVLATPPETVDPRRPRIKIITDSTGIEFDGPTVDLMDAGADGEPAYAIETTLDPAALNIDTGRFFL